MNIFQSLKQWREERNLGGVAINNAGNIAEELTELLRAKDEYEEVDALCDMVVFAVNGIEALGFDAEQAMLETMKEIHSRDGEYNKRTGKWEKYTYDAAREKWYEADYERARR